MVEAGIAVVPRRTEAEQLHHAAAVHDGDRHGRKGGERHVAHRDPRAQPHRGPDVASSAARVGAELSDCRLSDELTSRRSQPRSLRMAGLAHSLLCRMLLRKETRLPTSAHGVASLKGAPGRS